MKQLNSFMVLTVGGGERVTFTYDEINDDGEPISQNNKANFYAVDATLKKHIDAIRTFIIKNKMEG